MRIFGLILLILTMLTSCNESKPTSFDLRTFPNDWVLLTKKDGKFIIYNSCNAGNLLLTITKLGGKYHMLLHGTQEDDDFEIIESTQLMDTIFIDAKLKDSEEKQLFKFIWFDKQKGIGRWITTYPNEFTSDEYFVVSSKQSAFEIINQPCRECWGDECNEAKSSIELLNGFWQNDIDSFATLTIEKNSWIFNYNEKHDINDIYVLTVTDKMPDFVAETEKSEFLILANKTDTLKYEILGLTDSTLSLMYLSSGKIHFYNRMKKSKTSNNK